MPRRERWFRVDPLRNLDRVSVYIRKIQRAAKPQKMDALAISYAASNGIGFNASSAIFAITFVGQMKRSILQHSESRRNRNSMAHLDWDEFEQNREDSGSDDGNDE